MNRRFRETIKEAISINNMTQKELAAKLNISPQTLNSYLNGRSELKLDYFCEISKLLNLDAAWILSSNHGNYDTMDAFLCASMHELDEEQQGIIILLLRYFVQINKRKMDK